MTIPLNINGTTYFYPENGDVRWGPDATDWASGVTTGMLQKAGGLFQLLANVDFGSGYGLLSEFYQTRSSNTAAAGNLRLATTDIINWRNVGNTADLSLAVTGGELTFNSVPLGRFTTVTDTNSINLTLSSGDLSGVVRLSASAADAGYQLVQSSIKTDGLFGQISQTFSGLTLTGASGVVIATAGVLSSEALLSPTRGGTGVNNAGTLTYGSNNLAFTTSGATSLTLPTTGTLVSRSSTDTLTNKSIDGLTNTITNVGSGSFTPVLADANKALVRDVTGAVVSAFIVDANVDAAAAIARSKLGTGTANHVVINSGAGAFSSEAQLSSTRGGTGVNNSGTLTYGSNNVTFTTSGTTGLTLPTTGTVATLAGSETLTNKTLTSPIIGTDARYSNQAVIKFYEQTGNGTNYIGLCAPNAVTADKILKLPDGDGSNGQFITTDGSGNLSWGNASGLVNPMTSQGDMIYGGVSGAATRLPVGTSNQVLQSNGAGAPTWVSIVNANVSASAAIAYSKLALTGSIVDADVNASAAIAGSKIVSASNSVAGVVNTTTQTLAGDKTFNGNVAVNAGITFPATQFSSAGANTLDDYEEGTWTPAIQGFGSPPSGIAYGGGQTGLYVKVGRQVTVTCNIAGTISGKGTGTVQIINFPFAASTGTAAQTGYLGYSQVNTIGQLDPTISTTAVFYVTSGSGTANIQVDWSNGAVSGSNFKAQFSLSYFTAT